MKTAGEYDIVTWFCVFQKSEDQHELGFDSHVTEEEGLSGSRVWPGKAGSGSLGGKFEETWEINLMVKGVA